MLRLASLRLFGIRHALVALAVLATLGSAFGFHLHAGDVHQGIDHHAFVNAGHQHNDQVATKFMGESIGTGIDDLDVEIGSNSCGSCDCQVSDQAVTTPGAVIELTKLSIDTLVPVDQQLRDGITYQPDPPPVLG